MVTSRRRLPPLLRIASLDASAPRGVLEIMGPDGKDASPGVPRGAMTRQVPSSARDAAPFRAAAFRSCRAMVATRRADFCMSRRSSAVCARRPRIALLTGANAVIDGCARSLKEVSKMLRRLIIVAVALAFIAPAFAVSAPVFAQANGKADTMKSDTKDTKKAKKAKKVKKAKKEKKENKDDKKS
jgi:hypothetical protein